MREQVKKNKIAFSGYLKKYKNTQPIDELKFPIMMNEGDKKINFSKDPWTYQCLTSKIETSIEGLAYQLDFKYKGDKSAEVAVGTTIEFPDWSTDNYLLMPGAVYNGNRFESRRMPYSPKLTDPNDIGVEIGTIISDVPRLNINNGTSFIQQLAGDLATPAVGIYMPHQNKIWWILFEQQTQVGEVGIRFEESLDRKTATLNIMSPGVREKTVYKICDNECKSEDKGHHYSKEESTTINFQVYECAGYKEQDLFDVFVKIRKNLVSDKEWVNMIPFSACWDIQEEKYNTQNWVEDYGYYSVGLRKNCFENWQIGWTGGLIATYPLLFEGVEKSKKRACQNFDYVFPNGIAPSHFFYDCGEYGKWYGGDIRREHTKNWHLIRKSGDGLFFFIKQLKLLVKYFPDIEVKSDWVYGVEIVANQIVELWEKNHQLGQFVDSIEGNIVVGGSTSGASSISGLVLASQFLNDNKYLTTNYYYLNTAKEIGELFYEEFVKKGLTTGGPGDALQAPDSESCFALLNGFIDLYDATNEDEWIERAKDIANQFITWVVSYDFKFPQQCLFGRLDIKTTGSIYANVQNKHSAPGICTDSGLALLRLYRLTGEDIYLETIQETSHNLTQYLSRKDRPIDGLQNGWMNERVNMGDWLENVGEIFHGSTWAEVSNMLTFIEIPGIYIDFVKEKVTVFDHIEVIRKKFNDNKLLLTIINRTPYNAVVKTYVETKDTLSKSLHYDYLYNSLKINIESGECKELVVSRDCGKFILIFRK